MLVLSGCGGSPSVQASASILVSPTPEPTEVIATLEPQPTEGPDPVATEYALAALETPTATPISHYPRSTRCARWRVMPRGPRCRRHPIG